MKAHRSSARFRLYAWLSALCIGAAVGACGVPRDGRFVLLRRGPQAPGAPASLLYPDSDDAGAARVRRLMSDGFASELLRTFAMAQRLARQTAPIGSMQRARADAPAYVALGVGDRTSPADMPTVWIDERAPVTFGSAREPAVRDAIVLEQIASGFGREILSLVVSSEPAGDPLVEGYVRFLDVVAAEWRSTGETAAIATAARAAREQLRRADWFAAVRGNRGVGAVDATSPEALVQDPTVVATMLYRLAASSAGRRLAPDDVYRPLVDEMPPKGISPGHLLGAFRGFQAKLLTAWTRACRSGRAPRDLVDLVEAYAAAFPEERPDVTRIFLVTTYGVTARPGGVSRSLPPADIEAGLAALTADVLFGRSDLRSGMRRPAPAVRAL